ncbi:MAG: ParA family protein [Bacteroidota bacterium]
MKTYALYHLKGGVGKTSSSVNLAYLAAKEGHKTLIWDLDPQGASSYLLRQKAKLKGGLHAQLSEQKEWRHLVRSTTHPNLYLLPSDFRNNYLDRDLAAQEASKKQFKHFLRQAKNDFEYIFIDCPPSMDLAAENVFRAADFVLVPMIPAQLSEYALHQVQSFFDEREYDRRKIIPFFNLVDLRRKIHRDTLAAFKKKKRRIMRSFIPYSASVEKMGIKRAPIYQFSNKSRAASCYRNLWQELKWFKKVK